MTWKAKWLDDGFGNRWHKCDRADCGLQIVRPGKAQCAHGEPCKDAEAWMAKYERLEHGGDNDE